jgi:hypothetical protein
MGERDDVTQRLITRSEFMVISTQRLVIAAKVRSCTTFAKLRDALISSGHRLYGRVSRSYAFSVLPSFLQNCHELET